MTEDPFSELASQIYQLTKVLERGRKSEGVAEIPPEAFNLILHQMSQLKRDIDVLAQINEEMAKKEPAEKGNERKEIPQTKAMAEFVKQLELLKVETKKMQAQVKELMGKSQVPPEQQEILPTEQHQAPEKQIKEKFKDLKKRTGGKGWKPL